MNKNYLKDLSEEEREQIRVKTAETLEIKKQYALDNLKTTWSDLPIWREMAARQGTKLPRWYIAGDQLKYVKRLFRDIDIDIQDYIADMGCTSLLDMVKCNPTANAQAMVGWALEYIEERSNSGQH